MKSRLPSPAGATRSAPNDDMCGLRLPSAGKRTRRPCSALPMLASLASLACLHHCCLGSGTLRMAALPGGLPSSSSLRFPRTLVGLKLVEVLTDVVQHQARQLRLWRTRTHAVPRQHPHACQEQPTLAGARARPPEALRRWTRCKASAAAPQPCSPPPVACGRRTCAGPAAACCTSCGTTLA